MVAAATLLLVTGTGLATAELTMAPVGRSTDDAGEGGRGIKPDVDSHSDTESSSDREDLDKGDKPSPSKSKKPEKDKPSDSKTTQKPKDEFADLRDEVVTIVNDERAAAGCGAVTSNGKLVAAATGHSRDMADNGYFDHTSQDGRSFTDRARAQGYQSAIGENIAYGQTSAASVMDAWMKSDGHRANILNCDAKVIGMGVAKNGDGTLYWTQMFGSQ